MEALNLTRSEVDRLSEALKNETFRQLLSEYAAEISNPDKKRQYEEDMKQMEEDRGMNVQFIHPEAHHVLKTNSAGEKCFINVCSDPLIEKPSCEAARDKDGNPGQNWTLPYSLTPARPDRDAKGKACVIYDAIFHPDALHMAGENVRFMKLINSTAIKGIEDSFQMKLDSSEIKLLKRKYKGVPQPAVIRKPIPGFIKHKQNKCEENLSFPYPDVSSTAASSPDQTKSSLSKQPIKPHYTLKYRTDVDLQNYRYLRHSTSSQRPKDIIVIIDLPLLTSARDVDVNVMEKRLVLESQKPSYKLELSLSYPVDENQGEAKFNKTTKQLTLILPVLPKNTELPQMPCDDEEQERESEDKAELLSHQEKEKPHETQHTELNCDIQTQSKSDGCGQRKVAEESLHFLNSCDVDEMKPHMYETRNNITKNATEHSRTETEETDYFPHAHVPDDGENPSDMNINLQEMSVSITDTHVTPDEEFVKKQTHKTFETTAAFTHEPLISHDAEDIYQHSVTNTQPNLFPTDVEEPQSSSELTKPVSQTPDTTEEQNSELNHGNDTTVMLNEETEVQLNKPALCFQNSLRFDLD